MPRKAAQQPDRTAGDGERYAVRSVLRGISILETLGTQGTTDGLSVTEIAEGCGLSKSTTFGILQTLRSRGFVADDGEGHNRRYRLGMALARLGERARDQLSVRDIARPELRRLSVETNMSARLAMLDGDHAIAIDQTDSPANVRVDLRMGTREMLHCTGVGKAILACLPDEHVRKLLFEHPLPARTPHTITDPDQLLKHLDGIRRQGYSLDDEEDAEGIFCVGSGLRDDSGRCLGAISVTGLKATISAHRYAEVGRLVAEAAETISRRLGWLPESER